MLTLQEFMLMSERENFEEEITRKTFIRLKQQALRGENVVTFERFCEIMNTEDFGGYEGLE